MAVEAAVLVFRALFEAAGDDRVTFGIAKQMGEADSGGGLVVVSVPERREEVAHMHATEGGLWVGAVEFKAGMKKELLSDHHVAAEVRQQSPRGSVSGIGHEVEREAGKVLDEVDAVGSHNAAVGLGEAMWRTRPDPFPLRRQGEVVLSEDTLDVLRSPIGVERRMLFRTLREH